MKQLIYKINDDDWTFSILSRKSYEKKHGNDSIGIMDSGAKTVDFVKKEFSMTLLLHELFHVAIYYTFSERSYLSVEQLEESACELFAHKGHKIYKHAKCIYKRLK